MRLPTLQDCFQNRDKVYLRIRLPNTAAKNAGYPENLEY